MRIVESGNINGKTLKENSSFDKNKVENPEDYVLFKNSKNNIDISSTKSAMDQMAGLSINGFIGETTGNTIDFKNNPTGFNQDDNKAILTGPGKDTLDGAFGGEVYTGKNEDTYTSTANVNASLNSKLFMNEGNDKGVFAGTRKSGIQKSYMGKGDDNLSLDINPNKTRSSYLQEIYLDQGNKDNQSVDIKNIGDYVDARRVKMENNKEGIELELSDGALIRIAGDEENGDNFNFKVNDQTISGSLDEMKDQLKDFMKKKPPVKEAPMKDTSENTWLLNLIDKRQQSRKSGSEPNSIAFYSGT